MFKPIKLHKTPLEHFLDPQYIAIVRDNKVVNSLSQGETAKRVKVTGREGE